MEAHCVPRNYFSMHGVYLIMPEVARKQGKSSLSEYYLKTYQDTLNLISVPGLSHGVEVVLICMGGAMQSYNHECGTLRSICYTEQSWWRCGGGQSSLNSPDKSNPV